MASPLALRPPTAASPSRALVAAAAAAAPAPPSVASYTTLKEAMTVELPVGSARTNGPASQHRLVDVYGLLVFCSEAFKTRGSGE